MKGYRGVTMVNHDHVFDRFPPGTVPVAVEVRAAAEPLHTFEHPEAALYVFGPEDGSVPKALLGHCHRFVVIPTRHCLNLATAVATVLWDREVKRWRDGKTDALPTPGGYERRGTVRDIELVYGG